MPDALTLWSLAVLVIGGLMYAMMSMSTRSTSSPTTIAVRRPGWIARRRARNGITHPRDRIGVGYKSAVGAVHLTVRELSGHGALFGGPGSGKTTALQLLVEASADQVPVVIVDPKGSPALADTVRAHGGQVWTLDGKLPVDLMDPRPWQVPDLLLEAEDYSPEARAYRDAAHQRALWAAWALALNGEPMDLAKLRRLLDREELLKALEPHRGRDERIGEWIDRLGHQRGGVEDSGARGLDRSLGVLLDGVAMRGSLRSCPEALRLEDVLDTRGLVLFSLDVADYPHATRKVASWVLLGMGRLARQLPTDAANGPRALLLVDEVGALGTAARHLRGLVGRARESGLAVVLATQGPSDLEAVDRALLPQVLQDTAWQLAFRQGSPQDAERMQALFGKAWVNDESWSSDGRTMTRRVERPRVSIDEWMNALEPGDAWLRVAPIDKGWRQERVRVALPQAVPDRPVYIPAVSRQPRLTARNPDNEPINPTGPGRGPARPSPKVGTESEMVAESVESAVKRDGTSSALLTPEKSAALARVRLHLQPPNEDGCKMLAWPDGIKGVDQDGYPRIKVRRPPPAKGSTYVKTYKLVYEEAYGEQAQGESVEHACHTRDAVSCSGGRGCRHKMCHELSHLIGVSTETNSKKRQEWARRRERARATGTTTPDAPLRERFAIALFAGVDRPAVLQRTVNLDELRQLLSRFEVLADKRRGRCWSPTRYADGVNSRGNAGVAEVSALVFDLDRVPPDGERLAGVYWIGHTTWSHKPSAPRWRVVVPLATPVPAGQWTDVWRRARAALCPEADPACKDPSRAYWLPSHAGSVTAKTTCHEGPLLNPSTLPELPPEPDRPELHRMPTARVVRRASDSDRRRGEAYMDSVIDGLESTAPGGRNDALNRAAWTLGRWVAAGALEQADVEDELYAAAEHNHLVADDGDHQCWATIRSGLGAGLQEPIDLGGGT